VKKRRRQARTGVGLKGHTRAYLRERLGARRPELEQAILTRAYSISDPAGLDVAYLEGLRGSVAAALDYALETLECGEDVVPHPPPLLLAQARLAARNQVGLGTVLRRYLAGYTVVGDFLAREARSTTALAGADPMESLSSPAGAFDRLIAAVSTEYEREIESRRVSSLEQRQVERVRRLLGGEPVDVSDLPYDFDAHHVGIVASGDLAVAIRDLAASLDARPLLVHRHESELWAWLGRLRPLDPADLDLDGVDMTANFSIAVGEPGQGLAGWRLTHRQAAAALPVALRSSTPSVRYADVALLAAGLGDDLLAISLRDLYVKPLEGDRDRGAVARETLRAYLAAGSNVSSAAAALGVNRGTVSSRLRAAEERLRRPVDANRAEIELALSLAELAGPAGSAPQAADK
jgi:PucR C-terminal helix-turn-helix domain